MGKCILCLSEDTRKIVKIEKEKLIYAYEKNLQIDVEHIIKEDIYLIECPKCGMLFYDPICLGDEEFYKSLQKHSWYYMDDKWEFKIAMQYIKEAEKVLEIGSGKGAFAEYIKQSNYVGLEFSKDAISLAEKRGIKLRKEMIEEHAEKHEEKYDVISTFQVLEHVSNINSFICSSVKSLKKGGLLIISVPNNESFLKDAVNNVLDMPPHHISKWRKRTFCKIAELFNLELLTLEKEPLSWIHQDFYTNTVALSFFYNNGKKLLDFSKKYKIISKILLPLKKIIKIMLVLKILKPDGHTILAVYKKK